MWERNLILVFDFFCCCFKLRNYFKVCFRGGFYFNVIFLCIFVTYLPVYSENVSTWCAMAYWLCAMIHVPLALWVATGAWGSQHLHQCFVQILSLICVPTGAKGKESRLREHKSNLIAPVRVRSPFLWYVFKLCSQSSGNRHRYE